MQNAEIFHQLFKLSSDSPTGIINKRTGKPSGTKLRANGVHYWVLNTRHKGLPYHWNIPRLLFELSTGVCLSTRVCVGFLDGNRDNLSVNNLFIYKNTKYRI